MEEKEIEKDSVQEDAQVSGNEQESAQAVKGEATQESVQPNKTEAELSEMKDKYLRLYSDFENFRRRTAKEKLDLISNAGEELMKALIPVLDDFERAMKAAEKNDSEELKPVKEGVQLIYNKFLKTLQSKGLKAMEDLKEKPFDTELHEAITQIPAPTPELKGKVLDVIEKGYFLNEKVIRYAKVVTGA